MLRWPQHAEIRARLDQTQFNAQQLSNLLWALAVIEVSKGRFGAFEGTRDGT